MCDIIVPRISLLKGINLRQGRVFPPTSATYGYFSRHPFFPTSAISEREKKNRKKSRESRSTPLAPASGPLFPSDHNQSRLCDWLICHAVRMEIRRQSRNGHASDRTYQRTYKACLACRQRKAKCELGTGPDGHSLGPPCSKCRREQRECVFSEKKAWERQKKRGHSQDGAPSPVSVRPRLSSNPGISRDESHHTSSHGPSPLSYAEQDPDNDDSTLQPSPADSSQRRRQSTSTLANSMMRTVVSSGNDALNILFEAAAAHSKEHGNGLSESSTPSRNARSSTGRPNNYENSLNHSIVPPEVLAKAAQPVEISQASKEVLNVWGACRFVRMGWFTAREAVTFIDLFVY